MLVRPEEFRQERRQYLQVKYMQVMRMILEQNARLVASQDEGVMHEARELIALQAMVANLERAGEHEFERASMEFEAWASKLISRGQLFFTQTRASP